MKQKAILFAAIMATMSLPGCYMGNERASTQRKQWGQTPMFHFYSLQKTFGQNGWWH